MKKILLPLCAFAFGLMNVNAQKQLVKIVNYGITLTDGVESARTENGSTNYYYDKNNQKVLEMNGVSTKYTYSYDADGNAKKYNYSWSSTTGWTSSGYVKNEYDAEGNLTATKTYNLQDSLLSQTIYSDFENGYYKKMANADGLGVAYYEQEYKYTFNEAKKALTCISMNNGTENQQTTYTYNANGQVEKESIQYSDGAGGWAAPHAENTYYYNEDGSIDHVWQSQNGRWGAFVSDMVYVYDELAAAYAPTITSAEATGVNCVKLTWNAVEGATAYKVIYDQQCTEVTETTFTTPSILDGTHDFQVLTVVDGKDKNISEVVACTVKDEGKKPATDFAVGNMTQGEDEWGNVAYFVETSWTLPTDASPISAIKVYYGENSYDCQTINDPTATSATLSFGDWAIRNYDYELYEYTDGKEMTFSVVISYATGDSERSNVVVCNPYNTITDVKTVKNGAVESSANVYTLSGTCVRENVKTANATEGLVKGIYIVESGKTARKVIVK